MEVDAGEDDDVKDAIGSDVDEDELLSSVAPSAANSRPAASSSSTASMSAVERLNALLEQTEQFSAYVKQGGGASRASGSERSARSHLDAKEKEEDAALIEDELDEETHTQPIYTRLTEQPQSIAGEMRDYQLEALNWLIRLHDQNINGILADEMVTAAHRMLLLAAASQRLPLRHS